MKIGLLEAEISLILNFNVQDCQAKATIFQNGGQTVKFRTKEYEKSINDLHLRRNIVPNQMKIGPPKAEKS